MNIVDKSVLVISGLFLIVFSYLFSTFGTNNIATSGFLVGEISVIDNLVKRKGNKSIFWNEINQGQSVYDGDRIFSDTNSAADIQFDDKTILKVPSETLIVLSKNKEGLAIDLQHGLVDIYFGEKFKSVKIKSRGKIVEVKGTKGKVEIAKSKAGLSIIPSNAGVDVVHNNKKITLTKDTSFELSNIDDKAPHIIKNIKLILSTPPQMNLYKENLIKAKVSSSLKGKVEFEISQSPSFASILKERDLDLIPEEVIYKVNFPGTYYIRANQYRNNKMIGKSKTKKVRIFAELTNDDLLPSSDDEILASKSGRIEINWKARADLDYQIRLRDSLGSVTSYKSPTNSLILPVVQSGGYSYSVRALKKGFNWSYRHKIKVKVANHLKPLSPLASSVVMLETFPSKIKFEWQGLNDQKYLFKLTKKQIDQEDIVLQQKIIIGTAHQYQLSEPGLYTWSLVHEKFKEIHIPEIEFSILVPIAINLQPKNNKKIIFKNKNQSILFKWTPNKAVDDDELNILLSSDKSFEKKIKIQRTKNKAKINLNQLGQYYWKIKSSKNDTKLIESKTNSFIFDYPLSKIRPSIAKSQFINVEIYSSKRGHKIIFKGVPFAKMYQVEIYSDNKLKKLITKVLTPKTTLYWLSDRDGQSFIRVKTKDIWGRWSQYSNTGQLIFPISPLLD
jgi:hypothetical protein